MLDRIRQYAEDFSFQDEEEDDSPRLVSLRAAAAQLLVATGAGATLEHLANRSEPTGDVPTALAWAPALIGPLAAAANLEHARNPTDHTRLALRILSTATITFGASLFALDAAANRERVGRFSPLAFASAGLLGILLDREEREIEEEKRDLRRRADVVERLVPRRKPKLDRIVVHV